MRFSSDCQSNADFYFFYSHRCAHLHTHTHFSTVIFFLRRFFKVSSWQKVQLVTKSDFQKAKTYFIFQIMVKNSNIYLLLTI